MDSALRERLETCETDVESALKRFSGDEPLYGYCLKMFLQDPTMASLETAIAAASWDDAFTAAHALKGLAGNLGLVPLFHAAAGLVLLIRAGRVDELGDSLAQVKNHYQEIVMAIREGERV